MPRTSARSSLAKIIQKAVFRFVKKERKENNFFDSQIFFFESDLILTHVQAHAKHFRQIDRL